MNYSPAGPVRNSRPLFVSLLITVQRLICIVRVGALLAAWVTGYMDGRLFRNPIISDLDGGSKLYWVVINSCIVIADILISVFVILCITAFVVWVYRLIRKECVVVQADVVVTSKMFEWTYVILFLYAFIFLVLTVCGVGFYLFAFVKAMVEEPTGLGMGMLILIGPLVLVFCLSLVVGAFWFCTLIVPIMHFARRLYRYIMSPTIPKESRGGYINEENEMD